MLPIFPEESPSSDWRRDREPLPEAVVACVPPALWLIPQPTRLPLQKTRAADQRQQLQTSSTTVSARLSAYPAVDPLLADRQRASVLIRDDACLRRAARPGFARSLPAHFGFHEKYCVPPCGCWLYSSGKPRVEDRICHRRNIARGARNPTAPWRAVHSDNWQSIANTSLAWLSAP